MVAIPSLKTNKQKTNLVISLGLELLWGSYPEFADCTDREKRSCLCWEADGQLSECLGDRSVTYTKGPCPQQ